MEKKMLLPFFVAAMILATSGCKSNMDVAADAKQFRLWAADNEQCRDGNCFMISGRIPDTIYNGHKVFLYERNPKLFDDGNVNLELSPIDTAVVENQSFCFKGVVDQTRYAEIHTDEVDGISLSVQCILCPGSTSVTITHDALTDFIGGNKLNDRFAEFRLEDEAMNRRMFSPQNPKINRYQDVRDGRVLGLSAGELAREQDSLEDYIEKLQWQYYDQRVLMLWDVYHANEDNFLAAYAIDEMMFFEPMLRERSSVDSIRATAQGLARMRLDTLAKAFDVRDAYNAEMEKKREPTSEGKKYTDVAAIVKELDSLPATSAANA